MKGQHQLTSMLRPSEPNGLHVVHVGSIIDGLVPWTA